MLAIITGASGGMGVHFARLLAKQGVDLILTARREERLLILKRSLEKKYGIRVSVSPADLSVSAEVLAFSKKHFSKKVDILINNAGFGNLGFFDSIPVEKELSLLRTNMEAPTILMKAFLRTQKEGYILNIASVAGLMPGPLFATYYASKNYLVSLSRGVSEELKRSGSRVGITTMCPGPMKTEFFAAAGAKKEFATVTAGRCAKKALRAMFQKKSLVYSDPATHCLALLSKLCPTALVTKIVYSVQSLKFFDV